MLISTVSLPNKATAMPKFGAACPEPQRLKKYVRAEQDDFVRRVQQQDQEALERERRLQAKLAEEKELFEAIARAEAKRQSEKTAKADIIRQQPDEVLINNHERLAMLEEQSAKRKERDVKLDRLAKKIQSAGPALQQLSQIEEKMAETKDPARVLRKEGKKLPLLAIKPQPQTQLDGPYFDNYIMDMLRAVPAGTEQDRDFFKIKHHANGGFTVNMNINRGAELYLDMMEEAFEKDKHYPKIKKCQEKHLKKLAANTKFFVNVSEGGALRSAHHRYGGENDAKTWEPMKPDFEYGQPFIGMMMHRTWLMNEFFSNVLPLFIIN